MKRIYIFASLVLAPGFVLAESSCDLLLQHGITNITRHQSAEHAIAYKWHKYCGLDFNSVSDSQAARASIAIFGYGSGSAGYDSSSQRQKLSKWCQENQAFASSRSDLYEEAQTLSVAALSSWEQCIAMQRKQINITFLPNGENDEFIHFEIDSTHDGNLKYFGVKAINYTCSEEMVKGNKAVDPTDQPEIGNANTQIDCTRKKPQVTEDEGVGTILFEKAYIAVNTSGPSFAVAFPKVVSEYRVTPPGTVIAFDSDHCPEGWMEFDEAQGRFVLGASETYPRRSTGGRTDIPSDGSHSHGRKRISGHGFGDDNNDNQYKTSTDGAHTHGGNNMPPYVSLKYCKRK